MPKATIVNWRNGRVRRPRAYVDIVRLAVALAVSETQLDELLRAAGHPPLSALLATASQPARQQLERLQPYLRSGGVKRGGERDEQQAAPASRSLARGSQMPLAANPLFVGRVDELHTLSDWLVPPHGSRSLTAIAGLGGLGKTQLASEFVHRYGGAYEGGVFWLSFADPGGVAPQVARCGGPGGMALQERWSSLGQEAQVELVRAAWQSGPARLLVFDNCEDAALLDAWRPTSGNARVLLTTRQLEWDAALGVVTLPLGVLPRLESVALLRRHLPELSEDLPELAAIAAELGDLPLALNLAGHYLARYRYAVTPADYLRQLQAVTPLAHPSMQMGGRSPTEHLQHVERTLAVSIERLDPDQPTDARALALLERLACFAPGEPVARALLIAALAESAPDDPLPAEDALLRLHELGLAERGADGTLRMHRLVAFAVRRRGVTGAVADVERAVQARATQINEVNDVVEMAALRPHLHVVADVALDRDAPLASALAYALGYQLWMLADYPAAQRYLQAALQILERDVPPDPVRVGSTLNLLALAHQLVCEYDQAQRRFEQALAVWERSVGPDDPLTIDDVNNLGYLRLLQGDYPDAELHLRRALEARRRRYGVWSLPFARSMHNVGYLALKQGRYRHARRYLTAALAIRRQLLPAVHLSTAYSINFLGETLFARGEVAGAEALHLEALAMRRKLFGDRHHDTAESLFNLGRVRAAQGNSTAARELFEQALTMYLGSVGPTHRDTAFVQTALGALLRQQGAYDAARQYLLRARTAWEQHGGVDHPELVAVLCELGLVEQAQRRPGAARRGFEQALAIGHRRLGADHPDTRRAAALLAQLDGADDSAGAAQVVQR